MTKRLTIDSTGAVIPATRFVAQRGISKPPTTSPLNRLERILKKEEKVRTVLIRDRGGVGDMLMMTPTIRAIKQKYDCILDVATCPDYLNGSLVETLATNPHVDNIVDYRTLDKADYEVVINMSCPCAAHEVPHAEPINRVDLFARGAGLSLPLADTSLEYTVLDNEKQWIEQWLASRNIGQHKLLVIQANSSSKRRDMPQITLQKGVMRILRHYRGAMRGVVILHDNNKTPDINWNLDGVVQFKNFGTRQIAALTQQADLVLCPDSAVLHFANALHKKTVALFGPTDPRARVNYHPEAVGICPGAELSCWNCWYSPCWQGYGCWKRITDEMIYQAGIHLLENKQLPPHTEYFNFGGLIEGVPGQPSQPIPGQPFEVL